MILLSWQVFVCYFWRCCLFDRNGSIKNDCCCCWYRVWILLANKIKWEVEKTTHTYHSCCSVDVKSQPYSLIWCVISHSFRHRNAINQKWIVDKRHTQRQLEKIFIKKLHWMRHFDESSCCRFLSLNALITLPNIGTSLFSMSLSLSLSLSWTNGCRSATFVIRRGTQFAMFCCKFNSQDVSQKIAHNFPTLAVI